MGSVRIVLKFGDYELVVDDGVGEVWLTNAEGEGMTVQESEMADILDEYFSENF